MTETIEEEKEKLIAYSKIDLEKFMSGFVVIQYFY